MKKEENVKKIYKILDRRVFPDFFSDLVRETIEAKKPTTHFIGQLLRLMEEETARLDRLN